MDDISGIEEYRADDEDVDDLEKLIATTKKEDETIKKL
jgi:hypothetical protein